MIVLICGGREWRNKGLIRRELRRLFGRHGFSLRIVHGACRGADLLGEEVAKEMELDYVGYPARWSAEGRAAGPIRNRRMLDSETPDLILAFHNDLKESKGTKDMLKRATLERIPMRLNGEFFKGLRT